MASQEKFEQKREKLVNRYDEKLVKYDEKQFDYAVKLAGFDAKLEKLGRADRKLDEKRVTLYNFKIDNEGIHREYRDISKREYIQDYKPNNRGLLHKLESNLKIDVNIIPDQFVKTKKVVNFTGNALNTIALKGEDFLVNMGEGAARVSGTALMTKVRQVAYEQGQNNTGLRGALIVGGGAARAASWAIRHHKQMKPYNKQKFERSREKYIEKTEKLALKRDVERNKFYYNNSKLGAKEAGLSPHMSRKVKRTSWKELSLPTDPNHMHLAGAKGYLKKSRPERKMYNAEKKIYKKRTVRHAYFNEATGKTVWKKETVYDKSKPKEFKVKKPQNAFKALAGAGIGAAANKYFNQLAQSDNYGAEAMGNVARTAFSQLSRLQHSASSQRKKKMKFEKSQKKARLKYNKAEAKLQVRNVKQQAKAAQSPNKTTKKAAKKKRNGRLFRKKQAQVAKQKAANAAANKAANLISVKNKLIIGGAAAGILLVAVLPMLLLIGGGGSMGAAGGGGAAVGATVYPPDSTFLTSMGLGCNEVMDKFYNDCAGVVQAYDISHPLGDCDHSDECSIDSSTKYVFEGAAASYTYDIQMLCNYLTAKYRDGTELCPNDDEETAKMKAWSEAEAEAKMLVKKIWKLELLSTEDSTGTCTHEYPKTRYDEETGEWVDDGTETETDTYHIIVHHYYIISNPDFNLTEYISNALAEIGARDENGNVLRDKDGNTDGEAHYKLLEKSGGAHQVLSSPFKSDRDWISECSVFGSLPEQTETRENCIGISCGAGEQVSAGFKGHITNKGADYVEVKYEQTDDENVYIVTYYGGSTALPNGAGVEKGTDLFVTGGGEYNLEISVYDTKNSQYINPIFIFFANSKQENGEFD